MVKSKYCPPTLWRGTPEGGRSFLKGPAEGLLLVLILAGIGAIVFNLKRHTVLSADDFSKSFATDGLSSPSRLFSCIIDFYLSWGGRIWGEVLAQIFLHAPKAVFNVLNTIAYLAVAILAWLNIFATSRGRQPFMARALMLVYVNFMVFLCLQAFGQDVLWLCGASNYLWLCIIPLAMLLVLQKACLVEGRAGAGRIALALPMALMAGWSGEGLSAAMVLMGAAMAFWSRKSGRGDFRFIACCAAFMLIGMLLLWLAPGNFERAAAESAQRLAKGSEGYFNPATVAARLWRSLMYLFQPGACLIPSLAVLIPLIAGGRAIAGKERTLMASGILAMAFAASFSVAVIQVIYARMYFFSELLSVIASGIIINALCSGRLALRCVLLLCLAFSFRGFIHDSKGGIAEFEQTRLAALKVIDEQKALGNLDVVVMPNKASSRFCATYGGLDDIGPDPGHWVNRAVARTFGLKSIRSYTPLEAARLVNGHEPEIEKQPRVDVERF